MSETIQCDEVRPTCFNCNRHGIPCSLSQTAPPDLKLPGPYHREASSTLLSHSSSSHSSAVDLVAPLPSDKLWYQGFELMHHWCTATADTLSSRQDVSYVWRVAVPREGYKHPFVFHGIQAFAAVHKVYLTQSQSNKDRYLELCDYHSMLGLKLFRRELQDITEHNWLALFSFASVLVLYAFTLPLRSAHQTLADPISGFLELVSLLQGMKTTLGPLRPRVYRSELAPLVYGIWPGEVKEVTGGYPSLDNTFLPPDLWDATRQLRFFLETEVPPESLTHYRDAVNSLEYSARLVALAGAQAESGTVIAAFWTLNEKILVDIGCRKPYTLVLVAYYCVYLAGLNRTFWYARGWVEQVFDQVERSLASHAAFKSMLEWPRTHVSGL
ncbi:uncharacterized protein NECHADRAFT_56106 [Fusarium vanettenii 77-13-4]|uniref:Zn(2)-C6 fungal-type domain-containing protein n=1 Tax=Fusarium vanettenii (strain ATCC MYA-4622 / CBS 123669 / FGSC 9596 / NRRL 45880 / 77-13-4) TaxID=660122 RepID=C7ZQD3_FUSV7|nr:uncharacterized protein NECHADRAFT_56106 [Fusarium vanettenii 77-13-4]EEU33781.1 hypothetical protein NECHADRAFT_56106 [Fusarium vanettenii 77-13-4]